MLIIRNKTPWGPGQVRMMDLETDLGRGGMGKGAFMDIFLKEYTNE